MSNHARGLWGYSGLTASGRELTIQSTGMGGPSAALVLADLAKLGVRRAVRVGTCAAVGERAELGELLLPHAAVAGGGSGGSFGLGRGESVSPDAALLGKLTRALEASGTAARAATTASLDVLAGTPDALPECAAVDMQTVAVLARAAELGLAAAAVLIVSEAGAVLLDDETLAAAAARAGAGAASALSQD